MSTHLEELIRSSRELDDRFAQAWNGDRALRVREGAMRRHDVRVRRAGALRRGLVVAGGAGLLLVTLLRAASSAPAEPVTSAGATASAATTTASPAPSAEALALRMLGDAGYARD